jgi:hypothetical protein
VNAIVVLLTLATMAIAWLVLTPWLRARRRRALGKAAFPEHWHRMLMRRWPRYASLPAPIRQSLQAAMQVFLAEKQFIGCRGLDITDEMRVLVAAQACLLIVRHGIERFDHVRVLLMYPDTFVTRHEVVDEDGVHSVETKELGGESWPEGKVVLSWRDINDGLDDLHWRGNVVCHEFAHQLDVAHGAPSGLSASQARRWTAVFQREYDRLLVAIEADAESLFPDEAAENPAEFFAFVTETFIEHPQALRARHGELYAVLEDYFGLDPAAWSSPAEAGTTV